MSYDRKKALDYHQFPRPGKIEVSLTKPADNANDLSLAYSPGVAEPVLEIAKDPLNAYKYTGKGNTVAVISNGTAILGLGNLGPLASKPVMEGKALLFKRFANIDSFDIEVDNKDTQDFINTVANISVSFGGINLEDIKAPECFEIEKELIKRCDIPVFHDDQHGTAIVTAAGMLNALEIQGKLIEEVSLVCLGAGSAAIACMDMLVHCGLKKENITMLDSHGVLHSLRENLSFHKTKYVNDTDKRNLDDAILGADIFLGVSGANLLNVEQLEKMADKAIVFACANPDPEITPELVRKHRPDIIVATGRSDYPNQINNVLCFPYIFRGALDVRASEITLGMKLAAVYAIKDIAKLEVPSSLIDIVGIPLTFGHDYIIPKPIDPRLLEIVPKLVSQAAIDDGVATLID